MDETLGLKCTCPCIDCIEGTHCGDEYWDDYGNFIGICYYPTPSDEIDWGYLSEDDEEDDYP